MFRSTTILGNLQQSFTGMMMNNISVISRAASHGNLTDKMSSNEVKEIENGYNIVCGVSKCGKYKDDDLHFEFCN